MVVAVADVDADEGRGGGGGGVELGEALGEVGGVLGGEVEEGVVAGAEEVKERFVPQGGRGVSVGEVRCE